VPESDQSGKASSRIPEFASREEEADFWDTHDFTDFLDDTEPVKIIYGGSIYGPIDQIIAFRLAPDEEQELKRMADEAGESVSSLALRLVSEQIRKKTA
jgi:hypothetical protein